MTYQGTRRSFRLAFLASTVALPLPLGATSFNIDAQPAKDGLQAYAQQADVQVLGPALSVVDERTNAVKGDFDNQTALRRLIAGRHLRVLSDNGKTIVIAQAAPQPTFHLASQTTTSAPAPEPEYVGKSASPSQSQSDSLSEIVVTATKRSTNLQNVPLSITVVGGAALSEQHIKDGIEVARQTPNLQAESGVGAAMPRFRLRGIGTNEFQANSASPVGVYEDEVYLSGPAMSEPLYDLDRVEVLRGPQGTLWGKNTTAGAIHYVTTKPSDTFGGYADFTYGTHDTTEADAAIGGPLSDDLSYRVAGVYKHRDGIPTNNFNGHKGGGYTIYDFRAQLKWQIAANASLLLKGHGGRSEQDIPYTHVGLLAGGADADGYIQKPGRDQYSNNGPTDSFAHRLGGDAHLTIDMDWATLTEIASYERSSSVAYSDDDANPVSAYNERLGGVSHTVTNELRLASPDNQRLSWIVGGYFLHDKTVAFDQQARLSPINFGVDGFAYDLAVKTTNFAGFGSLTYKLTPRLKFTGGLRYTYERKSISGTAVNYILNPSDQFDASNVNAVFIDTNRNLFVDETGAPFTPPPPHRAWGRLTWDGTVDYKITDNILAYARVSRGFRSGNYNTALGGPTDLSSYDPETLTAYEGGFKTTWFSRKLIFNITGFHYDFSNMQVSVLETLGSRVINAASATVNGFEIESEMRPLPGLTLNAGYGLQISRYSDFRNASVPTAVNQGAPLDLTGQSLERAPRNTVNVAATYSHDLGPGRLSLNTDWRYTGRYRLVAWSDSTKLNPQAYLATPQALALLRNTFSQEGLWLGNATISFKFDHPQLEISGWVKNITDRYTKTGGFGMFFNRSLTVQLGEMGRTAGGTVGFKF